MKKIFFLLIIFSLILSLLVVSGCSEHTSKYNATGFESSNDSQSASMQFDFFEGRKVFTLKTTSGSVLHYWVDLRLGDVVVWIDIGNSRKELFSAKAGDKFSGTLENMSNGKVYIIVQTKEKCADGRFGFDVKEN